MSDIWKRCEGQIVDNQFLLLQFLANTTHSAVFLTNLAGPEPRKAAIKFISADIPTPEEQLGAWNQAAQLDHTNILRIFSSGRYRLAGLDILYVVMEHADEDLSQFLPQRALTAQEARDLLDPLAEALTYLHGKGFAHSHIKPSNLLAINDQLKISGDTLFPIGHSRESHRDFDVYDAPENSGVPSVTASAPADVWSLGVTLVEALTQQVPALPFDDSTELALSDTIPQPFLEIARHSLVRDPERRWSIPEVTAHLNPAPLAAAATASASTSASAAGVSAAPATEAPAEKGSGSLQVPPLSVPLSAEPAIPLAKLPKPPAAPLRGEAKRETETTIPLPSYVIPLALLGVLVVGAIFTLPKFFRHVTGPSAAAGSNAAQPVAKISPIATAKPAETKPAAKVATAENPAPAPSEQKKNVESAASSGGSTPTQDRAQAPAVVFANSSKSAAPAKSSTASPERGEVLEQVLPQVPTKAMATIHGIVRVVVRVQVDPVGNVTSADFDSPGPSKYFADLAMQAAQQWQFSSPVSDGHSLPSQWAIHFEFSPRGVVAIPTQKIQ